MHQWLSLWLTKPLPEALEREVNIERLIRLSKHSPIAAFAFSLNTLFITMAIWKPADAYTLLAWLAVFQSIAAWQIWGWWRSRDKPRPGFVRPELIERSFWQAAILGALLGAFAATHLPAGAIGQHLIISVVIVGTAAGSVVAFFPVPASALIFILLCICPPLAVVIGFGEALYYYLAALTTVFVVFLLFTIRRAYLNFIDSVVQKLEIAELAEKAQAANQAKSMFLAKMSHELRTPLNAINGFSDIMEKEMFGPVGVPQYADYMKSIHQSGERLLALVDNILDISRVDSGDFELDEKEADIAEIVNSCIAQYESMAGNAELEIHADITEPASRAWADPRRLRQILANLLDNAIKFTPAGGTVSITANTLDDGAIEIAVADTGIGIDENTLGDGGDAHVAREGEGARFGLALAMALSQAHGGTLSVDSEVGSGTIVRLTLPAERALARPGIKSSAT